MTRDATGNGYRMVAADGGIFSFGDVGFYGSLPQRGVAATDVVGMARDAERPRLLDRAIRRSRVRVR